jgi:hypothetical protein
MLARQRLDRGVHARLAHQFGRGNTRNAGMRRAATTGGAILNAKYLAHCVGSGARSTSAPPTAIVEAECPHLPLRSVPLGVNRVLRSSEAIQD